jgi:hypothetical protein
MPVTRDQARALARSFLDLAHQLGAYRFDRWGELTPAQRQAIEGAEWTLLNHSSDYTTQAVGLALDDLEADLKTVADATAAAADAIAKLGELRKVLKLAAGAVVLGGAIASQNPGAILGAAKELYATATA